MPLSTMQRATTQPLVRETPDVAWPLVSWSTVWNALFRTREAGAKYYNTSVSLLPS
jgi:hypothetical protein